MKVLKTTSKLLLIIIPNMHIILLLMLCTSSANTPLWIWKRGVNSINYPGNFYHEMLPGFYLPECPLLSLCMSAGIPVFLRLLDSTESRQQTCLDVCFLFSFFAFIGGEEDIIRVFGTDKILLEHQIQQKKDLL